MSNAASESGAGAITPGRAAMFAARAERLNKLILRARHALATKKADPDALLREAQDLSARHRSELTTAAGVHGVSPSESSVEPIPLHLLDTPDTRRLLELLTEAQEVAERVDAARGRSLPEDTPLLPGESRGIDLAETISEIALRVRIEVQGLKGRE